MTLGALEQVRELEKIFVNGMRLGDVEGLNHLMHADMFYITPSGNLLSKHQYLENYQRGHLQFEEIDILRYNYSKIANTVVVVSRVYLSGRYMNEVIKGEYRCLRVWGELNDYWQVISGSITQIDKYSEY